MKAYTVRELIIETQLQVQRLSSFKRDETKEQAILWRLNSAQERFIADSITPNPNNPDRFMINEKSRQAIQGLIKPNQRINMHTENSKTSYGFLPSDLQYLVNDRSVILEDCKDQFTAPTNNVSYRITVIPFIESPSTTAPYYNISISKTPSGGAPSVINKNYALANKKEFFELIEDVMEKFKTLNPYGVYWEKFGSIYNTNSILVVEQFIGAGPFVTNTFTLTVDGTASNSYTTSFSAVIYKTYAEGDSYSNRGYRNDFVYDAINNNYYERPVPTSPVSHLADNKIFAHFSERFLVPEIILDYIRKPRRISLYLNQTSDLDPSVHQKLCTLAAELILGNVEAQNYGAKVQENLTRID